MIYLSVDDIEVEHDRLTAAGVEFDHGPALVHTDNAGQFGATGGEEWMAFLRDSEGNLVGLVERRDPHETPEAAIRPGIS